MVKNFSKLNFIEEFTEKIPFRQGKKETEAGRFLLKILDNFRISYKTICFNTYLPFYKKFYFLVDNKKISSKPCCFKSGMIKDNSNILSSLISSQKFIDTPNINFNPKCKEISLANFYFAPSFAVSPEGLNKILKAKKIKGFVSVEKVKHRSFHILVGNFNRPKTVLFAHYDSIEKGAVDNASGVSILLDLILNEKNLLKKNLFVFSANEELSFDYPIYWGRGFRVFEKKFPQLMGNCKKIIVIDCIGNTPPRVFSDLSTLKLAFPIRKLEKLKRKITLISCEFEKLMAVYHSPSDDISQIKEKNLQKTTNLVKELLTKNVEKK
jgi:hypothetical protein